MRKLKFLLIGLLALTIYVGCHKDEVKNEFRENSGHLTPRTNNPTVINGMLHFDSYSDFEGFQENLKTLELDTNEIKSAYTYLGVNLNAEEIPNLTDHPVCLQTEMGISNFVSKRKLEEDQINTILNNGGDTFSIVSNPYLKSVLNADMSVQISSRIYKFYQNGGIAIIFNNDWNLYNSIKNSNFEDLINNFNLTITSNFKDDWDNYFTFNSNHSLTTEKETFLPRFYVSRTATNNLSIHNISLVESLNGSTTYTWLYSDNSTSVGVNPNRELTPNEPIKVVIGRAGGRTDTIPSEIILRECPVIVITNLSNNQVRFEDSNWGVNPHPSFYMRWVFSDGVTSSNNQNPFTRSCSGDGTVTCEYRYIAGNEIACSVTLPYYCKCGEGKNKFSEKKQPISGREYKIEVEISAQGNEVFARTKSYRKTLGIWFLFKNYNKLGAGLHGTYKTQNNPNSSCIQRSINSSVEIDGGTYQILKYYHDEKPNNVVRIPNALSSSHWMTKNGVTFGFGVGGSARLILD